MTFCWNNIRTVFSFTFKRHESWKYLPFRKWDYHAWNKTLEIYNSFKKTHSNDIMYSLTNFSIFYTKFMVMQQLPAKLKWTNKPVEKGVCVSLSWALIIVLKPVLAKNISCLTQLKCVIFWWMPDNFYWFCFLWITFLSIQYSSKIDFFSYYIHDLWYSQTTSMWSKSLVKLSNLLSYLI